MLVLDSGAVTRLSQRTPRVAALRGALRQRGLWPPVVPSVVLVECLTGDGRRDAAAHSLLGSCDVVVRLEVAVARRAARLRVLARRGSAVDAIVVASAEPNGTVLTSDLSDLRALASHTDGVHVERV